MRRLPLLVVCSLILVAGACAKRDPVAQGANEITSVPAHVKQPTPKPAGGPPENKTEPAGDQSTAAPEIKIPTGIQGRWGLTPGDCTSPLGDAKGLLVINGAELRFYESRAVPVGDVETDEASMTSNFRFAGEGQTWVKFERLQRSGDKLTRTETNPAASYTYAKC
jgi:hypothetical protein